MLRATAVVACWMVIAVIAAAGLHAAVQSPPAPAAAPVSAASARALLDRYCVTCHNEAGRRRGSVPISLQSADLAAIGADAGVWESVVRKLRAGMMPPAGRGAARSGDARAAGGVAGGRAGSRGRRTAEPGTDRNLPPPEPRGVPQRRPRPAGAGRGRRGAAAGRRCELRLRQHRRRAAAERVADGALPGGGGAHQPRRGGPAALGGRRRASSASRRSGGSTERMDGLPFGTRGGNAHHLQLPAGRRLRHRRRPAVPHRRRVRRLGRVRRPARAGGDGGTAAAWRCSRWSRTRASTSTCRSSRRASRSRAGPPRRWRHVPQAAVRGGGGVAAPAVLPAVLPQRQLDAAALVHLPAVRRPHVTITGPFNPGAVGETPSRARIFTCQPGADAGETACAREILGGAGAPRVPPANRRGRRRPPAGLLRDRAR